MLAKRSEAKQLAGMQEQIAALQDLSNTMKNYLEAILKANKSLAKVVETEDAKRTLENHLLRRLKDSWPLEILAQAIGATYRQLLEAIVTATSEEDLSRRVNDLYGPSSNRGQSLVKLGRVDVQNAINELRREANLPEIAFSPPASIMHVVKTGTGKRIQFSGIAAEVAAAIAAYAKENGMAPESIDPNGGVVDYAVASGLDGRFLSHQKMRDAISNVLSRLRQEAKDR